ncbi:dethiobiotin synthetase [Ekhidna lutea]|uniref:ATP-dependent dethiobiotin synthetase BioD n=1 Tax=Ekhidna lutea TaxID=447679 RepID=A0A239F4T3_EKHLU|nr:dethiobiotin synthase [Ekhidna lutea]SNS51518.1 dethiobiotin synthetase [Ekhidna lutea]
MKIIIAGIGTDTGKTVASAILCKALKADYWKPVQAGDLENTDSHKVKKWSPETIIHPEAYRLTQPMSPHAAATIDDVTIEESRLQIPTTDNNLIIELAGGLMVPIREDYLNIDWVASTGLPVILVSNYYLGSINHTLLSLYALKSRNIPLLGLIFNGEKNPSTFDVIMQRSEVKCLLEIEKEEEITSKMIEKNAAKLTFV